MTANTPLATKIAGANENTWMRLGDYLRTFSIQKSINLSWNFFQIIEFR